MTGTRTASFVRIATIALCLGALAGAASCVQILGIEDAHVDRDLEQRQHAGQGGSTGAGTGGAAPGSGAGSSDADAGAQPPSNDCQRYCADLELCKDVNAQQYLSTAMCLKACSLFAEHGDNDKSGDDENSVACRLKYAQKLPNESGPEAAEDCVYAGPGGGDKCGSVCEGFCTLMMATCTRDNVAPEPWFFETMDACLSACNALPLRNEPYSTYDSADKFYGDGSKIADYDQQCRLFHVSSALLGDLEHCEHALGSTWCVVPANR
jgi:hypothetical protein